MESINISKRKSSPFPLDGVIPNLIDPKHGKLIYILHFLPPNPIFAVSLLS
jgi:hypothetical protein